MALQSSGEISLSNVNVELGLAANAGINMNAANVRTLFGVPSGAISMSHGYGKSNIFYLTISSAMSDVDLRALAVNAGWNQDAQLVATISSGVTISSTSTASSAMTVAGSFPRGVSLVNNGTIVGKGGQGGNGNVINGEGVDPYYRSESASDGFPGGSGGVALAATAPCSITNNGVIGGGGGGGGGGGACQRDNDRYVDVINGGGGGGAGAGIAVGGAGGLSYGYGDPVPNGAPGGASTLTSGASGGLGVATDYDPYFPGGAGGSGGGMGASGSNGMAGDISADPYGYNIDATSGGAGGAAGAAVSGNANITWVATGTRYGAIT